MGWSDVTLSMKGPIVNSLINHFADRWYVLKILVNKTHFVIDCQRILVVIDH